MENFAVAIPTKREEIATLSLLSRVMDKTTLFVDQSDTERYKDKNVRKVEIPENIFGMGAIKKFITNFMHDKCRFLFILDDDILSLLERDFWKPTPDGWGHWKYRKLYDATDVFEYCMGVMKKTRSVISGLAYTQFNSWWEEIEFMVNRRHCSVFVGIDLEKIKVNYDENCVIWEDFDLNVNTISQGQNIVCCFKYGIITKPMTKNPGGCQRYYEMKGLDKKMTDYVIGKYPGKPIKVYNRKGVVSVKTSWKKLAEISGLSYTTYR